MEQNLDSISNPFEHKYFKMKKIEIIEKMAHKSQQSGSSSSSDGNFSNCNECKTRENSNFLKNGKMVISIKIQKFSRSRMTKRTSLLESSREI